ncbi:MAG: type 4a pilus biogenesis protein PilO [Thermoguttaceae bacterium]
MSQSHVDPSGIENRLRRLRIAVHTLAAAGLALLLLMAWWSPIRPLKAEQCLLAQRASRLEATRASGNEIRARHSELQQQLAAAQQREALLLARIPNDASEEEFLANASRLAGQHGLKIHNYRPAAPAAGPSCSSLEIELVGEGDFESVCRFLDGLAKSPRQLTVSSLHLNARDDGLSCQVETSIVLYFGATVQPETARKEAHGG